MRLPIFVARKYFLSKENTNAINIMSLVSIIGMAIGTMALIVVLSVFNGFESLVISLYGSFYPDISITPAKGKVFVPDSQRLQKLKNIEQVAHYSKTIEENVLLKHKDQQYIATIKGVDDQYRHINRVSDFLIRGEYKLKEGDQSFAILGSGVEARLGVNINNLFQPIHVYVPRRGRGVTGMPGQAFHRKPIYASGTFSIQQDFDLKYVIVPMRFARDLLRYDREISSVEVAVRKESELDAAKAAIQNLFGDAFIVKDRFEQNKFLYRVMQSERWAVYCILTFILLLLAFNIIGSLTMLVIEKREDIAILKSMGGTNGLIRRIFLTEGVMIATVGGAIGAALAVALCSAQEYFEILKITGSGSFVVDAYPVEMQLTDFLLVFGTVLGISLLASWYPALRAARTSKIVQHP